MKPQALFNIIVVLLLSIGLTSCEAIGDIFQAGMWAGVIVVVLIVAVVFWIFRRIFR